MMHHNLRKSRRIIRVCALALVLALLNGCATAVGNQVQPAETAKPATPVHPTDPPGSLAATPEVMGAASAAKPGMATPTPTPAPTRGPSPTPTFSAVDAADGSRGYMTTPAELRAIKAKADTGLEPYASALAVVLRWAERDWDFDNLKSKQKCREAEHPSWNDNDAGTAILYAKALAYHLTGESRYAAEVKQILERIMTEVEEISLGQQQCRLNFAWGTPEMVAAADLIELYWRDSTCTGPATAVYGENELTTGNCKTLFQNWLVKNPYYVVSYSAAGAMSNWGAAATNATAAIADYLWDRPQMLLVHRYPGEINDGKEVARTPAEAYAYANQLALDRMNGYGVEHGSRNSCDYLAGAQQSPQWEPVKSQITPDGIIPEDARREEFCNIPRYQTGEYQNYPQLHISNNIQQCELMLRRGDRRCYENVDMRDMPNFTFVDPDRIERTTHLQPGRGSLERAINAIIVDADVEWRRDSALAVAYRYYYNHHRLPGFAEWFKEFDSTDDCSQDICFGILTHGFAPGEAVGLPPIASEP